MAIALANQSLRVLPLVTNSKRPKLPFDRASSDPVIVGKLFSDALGCPSDANIAIMTGEGLIVVDIDKKEGDVKQRWRGLEASYGKLPHTVAATTANGGIHLYLRVPAGVHVASSQSTLAPCVDVRGERGYVVAPGSLKDGGSWAWLKGLSPADVEIADCHAKLLEAVRSKRPRSAENEKGELRVIGEADTPAAIAQAIDILRSAPEAVDGAGGRKVTHPLAHRLMDIGCLPATAAALMSEHWDSRNSPPWDEDLLPEVLSLVHSRQNPIGCAAVGNAFEAVEGGEAQATASEEPARARPYFLADEADALAMEDAGEALIEGWLDAGGLSVWYGPSGAGKTLVILSACAAIVAGSEWAGCATARGPVLYIALEGGKGIRRRVAALRRKLALPDGAPLAIMAADIDLTASAGVQRIVKAAKQLEQETGARCAFVVIDTLSRAMAGANENDAADMTAFVKRCDQIRSATGAAVALVHHAGKDASRGARGHSSLRAAVDTEIEIEGGKINATKQRDMETSKVLHFTIETVFLGNSAKGLPVTSAIALVGAANASHARLTKAEVEYFEAFEGAQEKLIAGDDADQNPLVTGAQWNAEADARIPVGGKRGRHRNTRNAMRRSLTEKAWIEKSDVRPDSYRRLTGVTENDGF